MIKRIAILFVVLMPLMTLPLVMLVPVAHSVPEPRVTASPQPPVIGHYCVVTRDAAISRGMPQGMQIWMSMNMKNTNDGPEWACADMPNPWAVPN